MKVVLTCLLSRHKTSSREQASFLCFGELSHSVQVQLSFLGFVLSFSVSWTTSKSSFHAKCLPERLRTGHLSSLCHSLLTVPIYANMCTFMKFLWLHIESLWNSSSVDIPTVSSFFRNVIYVLFEFHLQHYHFSFLCSFIFIAQFPLWIIHCKCHSGLSPGNRS